MADLLVKASPKGGRGVFAARRFAAGEVIEVCPVIAVTAEDAVRLDDTYLYNYYFGWGPDNKGAAIALGFGSLYNHADSPNAVYRKHPDEGSLSITALMPIAPGDEVLIRYNFGAEGSAPWFDVR